MNKYVNEIISLSNLNNQFALPIDQNVISLKVFNGGSFYCVISTSSAVDGVIVNPNTEFDFNGKKNQILKGLYFFTITGLFVKAPPVTNCYIIIKRLIK